MFTLCFNGIEQENGKQKRSQHRRVNERLGQRQHHRQHETKAQKIAESRLDELDPRMQVPRHERPLEIEHQKREQISEMHMKKESTKPADRYEHHEQRLHKQHDLKREHNEHVQRVHHHALEQAIDYKYETKFSLSIFTPLAQYKYLKRKVEQHARQRPGVDDY